MNTNNKYRLTKYLVRIKIDNRSTLWFHTLNGAIDLISQESPLNSLLPGKYSLVDSSNNNFLHLKKRGYFLSPNKEKKLFSQILNLFKEYLSKNKQIQVTFILTSLCNLRCPYCINYLSRNKLNNKKTVSKNLMTKKTVKKAFDFLDWKIKNEGLKILKNSVGLYGGEPLLDICLPAVEQIATEARKRKLKINTFTNGTFSSKIRKLILTYKDIFNYFKFTLDGPQHIHNQRRVAFKNQDTFSKIVDNIDWALKNGFTVDLRFNLDKQNINYFPQLAKFIIQKGWHKKIKIFQTSVVKNNYSSITKEETLLKGKFIKELLRLLKNNPELEKLRITKNIISEYAMPVYSLFIKKNALGEIGYVPLFTNCATCEAKSFNFAWDGKIYGCFNAIGEKKFEIGEYFPKRKMNKKTFSYWKNLMITNIKVCKECNYQLLCGGACPYNNYIKNKSINKRCDYFKEYFTDAVKGARKQIYSIAQKRLNNKQIPL